MSKAALPGAAGGNTKIFRGFFLFPGTPCSARPCSNYCVEVPGPIPPKANYHSFHRSTDLWTSIERPILRVGIAGSIISDTKVKISAMKPCRPPSACFVNRPAAARSARRCPAASARGWARSDRSVRTAALVLSSEGRGRA